MSILLIEDSPERIRCFRRCCAGMSLTNITTASTAIAWLKDHTPSLLFLDYDLHEYGADIKTSGCGGDVVSWMTKQPDKRFHHTLVVIHSLNEVNAERMRKKLEQHAIVVVKMPFVWRRPADMARLIGEVS